MHQEHDNTIAVAMSEGVESSAVAAMLCAEGFELIGLTLQLWNHRLAGREGMPEQGTGRCCSIDDVYDARRVAERVPAPVTRAETNRSTTLQTFRRIRPLTASTRRPAAPIMWRCWAAYLLLCVEQSAGMNPTLDGLRGGGPCAYNALHGADSHGGLPLRGAGGLGCSPRPAVRQRRG